MELNKEQLIAATHVKGPLLIFAGAGSGKTRVITHRIHHLITSQGIEAKKIIALSFTNKSAREMRERVKKMLPKKNLRGIEISTFHSLGLKLLKKFIHLLGYNPIFNLLPPQDTEGLLQDILKQHRINPDEADLQVLVSKISRIKNSGNSILETYRTSSNTEDQIAVRIFDDYVKTLFSLNSVDFDDLILLPVKLLNSFEEVTKYCKKNYEFYMVDEFQDTNPLQYTFLKLMIAGRENLCVVGDDDQSIYGFRGSEVNLILNFEKDFKGTKTVHLLQNYRSSLPILNAANSLISKNPGRKEKVLWSKIQSDEKVRYVERLDEKDEASYIADIIESLIIKKKQWKDFSILFRTNYQSKPFEEEFRLRSIPYKLIGAYSFFDRKEVRDIIAYLRVIANPKDEVSLLRILNYPRRGLGAGSISKIREKAFEKEISLIEVLERICSEPEYIPEIKRNAASQIYEFLNLLSKYKKEFFTQHDMSEVLKKLIKEIDFEKEFLSESKDEKVTKARLLNLSEVVNIMRYFQNDWENEQKPTIFDFLLKISLMTNDDESEEENKNRVQLMTLHLSKGLEFPVVFLVGAEEGIIPSTRTMNENSGDVTEERRLFYVGMTRAKELLYITSASRRKKYGEYFTAIPSRFIEEIGSDNLISERIEADNSKESSFIEELQKIKNAE